MTITHAGQGRIIIKSKDATITLGKTLKIGEKTLPGRGEYEVSGVEAEGYDDGIFLIRTEDVFLLYLDRIDRELTDQELEEVNLADILFVPVGGDKPDSDGAPVLTPERAVKVINQVDPRIVIPTHFASIEPFRAAEGKPLEVQKELKVTRSTLPQEDRVTIVLEPCEG